MFSRISQMTASDPNRQVLRRIRTAAMLGTGGSISVRHAYSWPRIDLRIYIAQEKDEPQHAGGKTSPARRSQTYARQNADQQGHTSCGYLLAAIPLLHGAPGSACTSMRHV